MFRKKIKTAQLPGGLADKAHKSFKDFSKSKLDRGEKVEREHTKSKRLARTIAMDHLVEDPQYYEKLQRMEKRSHLFQLAKLAKGGRTPPPLPRKANIPNISQAERESLVQKLREDRRREALGLGASRAPARQAAPASTPTPISPEVEAAFRAERAAPVARATPRAAPTSASASPTIERVNTNPPLARPDALGASRAAVESAQRRAAASPTNQEIAQLRAQERQQALTEKLKQRQEQRVQAEKALESQRLNAQRPGSPYPETLNAQIKQDPGTLAALRADRLTRAQRRAEARTQQGQRPHGAPVSAVPTPGAASQSAPAIAPAPAPAPAPVAATSTTPAPTTSPIPAPAAATPKPKKPKAAPSGGINPLVAGAGLMAAGAGLHSMMSSDKQGSARISTDSMRAFVEEFDKIAKELTTAGRERIKTKNFAIPETEKYPIHDAKHARNALARVSQHGTPEEKVRVRSAVAKKWPGLVGKETKKDLRSGGISRDEPAAGTVLTEKLKHSAAMCGAARRVGKLARSM